MGKELTTTSKVKHLVESQIQTLASSKSFSRVNSELSESMLISIEEKNNALVNMSQDVKFRNIDFTKFNNLNALTLYLGKNGSSVQKNALAQHLSFESLLSLPNLQYLVNSGGDDQWKDIINLIESEIESICKYFGLQFTGDRCEVAWQILDDFGHNLTIVDLFKFSSNCKKQKYKTSFQNISVRGVTSEFLIDWLYSYLEEKSESNKRIADKIRSKGIDGASVDGVGQLALYTPERAKEYNELRMKKKARSILLESREWSLREDLREREKNMTYIEQFEQFLRFHYYDIKKSKDVALDSALLAREKRIEFETRFTKEYNLTKENLFKFDGDGEKIFTTLEEYISRSMKLIENSFEIYLSKSSSFDIVMNSILSFIKQNKIKDTRHLMETFTGKERADIKQGEDKFFYFVSKLAQLVDKNIEANYEEHREISIESNVCPLEKKVFFIHQARIWSYKKTGILQFIDLNI